MSPQDERYSKAAAEFGAALVRLGRAYENDAEKRRDLLQEIHLSLWRSFAVFDSRCSLRTWVYRVAHASAISWSMRQRRAREWLVALEDLEVMPAAEGIDADRQVALARLTGMIRQLKPVDRQVILSYLEGLDAVEIGEITGLSARNVATRIHRIKSILARDFHGAVRNG